MKEKMRFGSLWIHNNTNLLMILGLCQWSCILMFGENYEIKFRLEDEKSSEAWFLKNFTYIGEE